MEKIDLETVSLIPIQISNGDLLSYIKNYIEIAFANTESTAKEILYGLAQFFF